MDWICLSHINAANNTVLPYAGQVAARGLALCEDSGSANAYAATLSPTVSSYTEGLTVLLRAGTTNTGACTLAVDGLTAVAIKMPDGANALAGAMCADGIYLLCYDGSVFKLLNASQAQVPAIIQTQTATYSGYAALSTTIPLDDTIPTSTEGAEMMSVSITPTTSSRMIIRVNGMLASGSTTTLSGALVVHGESAAFAASGIYVDTINHPRHFTMFAEHQPGSTTPITYKFRAGGGASTMRPNGNSTGRLFGGTARWVMTVEEYSQ